MTPIEKLKALESAAKWHGHAEMRDGSMLPLNFSVEDQTLYCALRILLPRLIRWWSAREYLREIENAPREGPHGYADYQQAAHDELEALDALNAALEKELA